MEGRQKGHESNIKIFFDEENFNITSRDNESGHLNLLLGKVKMSIENLSGPKILNYPNFNWYLYMVKGNRAGVRKPLTGSEQLMSNLLGTVCLLYILFSKYSAKKIAA